MYKFLGVFLVVLALATAVTPHYTDCLSQRLQTTNAMGQKTPMKCHWSANAEIALGIPLGVVGVMSIFSRRKESLRNLSLGALAIGVMVALIPTKLIGVCPTASHICHTTMQPAMAATGAVISVTSVFGLVMSMRKKDDLV